MLEKIAAAIDTLNDWIGRKVAWLSLAMALVMFLTVVLRYAFDLGWIWMQESVFFMHGALFMLAAGFTLKDEQHVRIDLLYNPMSPRKQALVNIFGTLFLLFPTCIAVFYFAFPYVQNSWAVFEGSREAGGLPGIFLLKTIILIFPVLLALQGLAKLLRAILVLTDAGQTHP